MKANGGDPNGQSRIGFLHCLSADGCPLWERRAGREFIYFEESVRAVLAGSLLDGALAPVVIGGTIPAWVATVIRVIPVGNNPVAVSLR
jgi:hypothetical protein